MKIIEITNVDFSLRHFLLPLMRAARDRGHEVIGACAEGPLLAIPRAEGFRIVALPLERRVSLAAHWRAFRALVRLFRAERPDMVHAHMPISGFLARMAAWWAGVPHIAYTGHGFWFNFPGSRPRQAVGLLMELIAGRVTRTFLTVSEAEARDARRLWIHRGAVAVRNGRDPTRFRPDPAARARVRAELGTPEERVVILAVSRLVWHKGYPELAAAIPKLPDVELWVVGERLDSDRGPDMAALLRNAGLGDRLKLLGYREDVPALMAAADVFTLPSHFEGLPMSVIEAMLTGLPVVATDVRGPAEQVMPGETGLLVPPADAAALADALGRLARDPDLRARMGAAGRRRALDCYDEAKVLARTLDLLGL
ncbi:MAG: glycosyltransferase family 1 protein [Rhodospirillales bacterium 69-11]|nr:MAG: glycosyltransferase family 1 protein [Rhodospirillales bacterium 69-11]